MPLALVAGKQAPVPVVERSRQDVLRIAKGLQKLVCRFGVLEYQRGGGVLGQHLRLGAGGVHQVEQAEDEAADDDNHRYDDHRGTQRNPVDVP